MLNKLDAQRVAYACIEKIGELYFRPMHGDDSKTRIPALLDALCVVDETSEECAHVRMLWLAWQSAEEQYLDHLALYRSKLFGACLKHLQDAAAQLPEEVRNVEQD